MDTVNVIDIIGSTSAVSPRAGLKAYDFVVSEISKHHALHVNFEGVQDLTSAFCNSFIGKLYMNFDTKVLSEMLYINGIDKENIWYNKVQNAINLGSNEHARTLHNSNLNDIIES